MINKFLNIVKERFEKLSYNSQSALKYFFAQATAKELPRVCVAAANILLSEEKKSEESQFWLALAAWGFFLNGEKDFARIFSVAAREQKFLEDNLLQVTDSKRVDLRVFESLLGLPVTDIGHAVPDEIALSLREEGFAELFINDWYALLSESIPAKNHEHTALALNEIAKFWLDSQQKSLQHPIENPGFEPLPCALAVLAFDNDFSPEGLPDQTRLFYALAFKKMPKNQTLSQIIE